MNKLICIALIMISTLLNAQQKSVVKVYNKLFTTYPFSDPDPIADPSSKIYPYNHFDGYTNTPVQKEWKVVELENDYIRVMILPEIGGKIWSAVEKKTGKEFIYYNHVVKFRDVAMRGAWTSGGIESNYGTIGHTPNCSTPVDYTTSANMDGSVSCVVGALDLLTRTPWRIDINLPADKAYFTTRSFWFNASGLEQPYYHWMNAGIKATGNVEFIYPGTRFIGHEGEPGDWPINSKNGKNISFYNNNNFGTYKSYHVFGKYTNFFGAYWHDDNYGVVRYSTHDDKPGKKLWIWGLSQQGMIWEKLLTDNDGQYVEIQSGRLFNQSAAGSALTPFKHRGFAPYATDTWTEYWYPVMNSKGYVYANQYTALNVKKENDWLKIYLSPVQAMKETLSIVQNGTTLYSKAISLSPLTVFSDSIRITDAGTNYEVKLGADKISWKMDDVENNLSRPTETPVNFDQSSMYGLYLQGKNSIYFRQYIIAEEKMRACLEKEKAFVPALVDLSMLLYRKMNYEEALLYAKKALSINSYDPGANYYYGLINKQLGKKIDAIDGFDIATQSEEYRTPAFTELAKIYFSTSDENNDKAIHYAEKALAYNQQNLDALQIMAVAYRVQKDKPKATAILARIQLYDPLNCFAKFENYLWEKTDAARQLLAGSLQNEMPDQSYLELSIWYYAIGCEDECKKALQLAPSTAEINFWLAYLSRNTSEEKTYYQKAIQSNDFTAFPFRTESTIPLRWFIKQNKDWQPIYNLGLIEGAIGNLEKAKELLLFCGQQPSTAIFYSTRAKLNSTELNSKEADLKKAIELDPTQWRFYKQLTDYYNLQHRNDEALSIAKNYYQKNPTHYIMGMLLAKTYLLNKNYSDAAGILDKIVVIPYEGATDGRGLYKEAHLMLAVEAMKKSNYKRAINEINLSKQWPESLGVGKPYEEDIDERLENFLLYNCYNKLGDKTKSAKALDQIKINKAKVYTVNEAITAWATNINNGIDKITPGKIEDENERVLREWLKK